MDLLKAFIKKRCVEGMWWSADMGEIRLAYRKYVEHHKGTEVSGKVFEREIEENFGRTNERYIKYAVHLRTDPYSEESDSGEFYLGETSSDEPYSKEPASWRPKAKTVAKTPQSKTETTHTLLTGMGVWVDHEDPKGLMKKIKALGEKTSLPTGPFKVFAFRLGKLCDLLETPRPDRPKMRVVVVYAPPIGVWVLLEENFLAISSKESLFGTHARPPRERDLKTLEVLGPSRWFSEVAV